MEAEGVLDGIWQPVSIGIVGGIGLIGWQPHGRRPSGKLAEARTTGGRGIIGEDNVIEAELAGGAVMNFKRSEAIAGGQPTAWHDVRKGSLEILSGGKQTQFAVAEGEGGAAVDGETGATAVHVEGLASEGAVFLVDENGTGTGQVCHPGKVRAAEQSHCSAVGGKIEVTVEDSAVAQDAGGGGEDQISTASVDRSIADGASVQSVSARRQGNTAGGEEGAGRVGKSGVAGVQDQIFEEKWGSEKWGSGGNS